MESGEADSIRRLLSGSQAMRFVAAPVKGPPAAPAATIETRGGGLTLIESGGAIGADNLAPGGIPFALDELAFTRPETGKVIHFTVDLNDGVEGDEHAWIGGGATRDGIAFAGIGFGARAVRLGGIAIGRDNEGVYSDRTLGRYVVQFTRVPDPHLAEAGESGDPRTGWTTLGTMDYRTAPGVDFSGLARRHRFAFDEVQATGVRLVVPATGLARGPAIDEIELYPPARKRTRKQGSRRGAREHRWKRRIGEPDPAV